MTSGIIQKYENSFVYSQLELISTDYEKSNSIRHSLYNGNAGGLPT